MARLQTAMQVGQSHLLSLTEAELNQWMRDNLAIASAHQVQQAGIPVPPGHEASVQEVQSAFKDIRMSLLCSELWTYVADFVTLSLAWCPVAARIHLSGMTLIHRGV